MIIAARPTTVLSHIGPAVHDGFRLAAPMLSSPTHLRCIVRFLVASSGSDGGKSMESERIGACSFHVAQRSLPATYLACYKLQQAISAFNVAQSTDVVVIDI